MCHIGAVHLEVCFNSGTSTDTPDAPAPTPLSCSRMVLQSEYALSTSAWWVKTRDAMEQNVVLVQCITTYWEDLEKNQYPYSSLDSRHASLLVLSFWYISWVIASKLLRTAACSVSGTIIHITSKKPSSSIERPLTYLRIALMILVPLEGIISWCIVALKAQQGGLTPTDMDPWLYHDIQVQVGRLMSNTSQLIRNVTTNGAESWTNIQFKYDGGKIIDPSQVVRGNINVWELYSGWIWEENGLTLETKCSQTQHELLQWHSTKAKRKGTDMAKEQCRKRKYSKIDDTVAAHKA